MTITLQRLATTGETAYISKHNANIEALEAAINVMSGTVDTLGSAAASPTNLFNIGKAMFGPIAVALVGETSFDSSTSGTNMTLQPGFFWSASAAQMAYKPTTTVIPFAGAAAGTYYIRMGVDGIPYRDTSSAAALYSVVWTGTAFGTVAKLATYAPGYQDLLDLLSSGYSGLTYTSPDKRIEATEKAFSALLSKSITTADVTLTTAEAMEQGVIRLSGTPTAARNLIVPAKAKVYFIDNDTAGSFAVTVKTAAGTGVALPAGTNGALFCDGTNVVSIASGTGGGGGGASAFTGLSDVPASYSGQANKLVKVKADESGLEYTSATAPTVFTGLTDAPASYTGQAGKVPVVKGDESGLEFGSPVSTYLALTDTPDSFAGQAFRVVSVKGDESGLEFSAAAAPSTLLALTDTPDTYASSALKVLRVNAAGTGVEFAVGTGPANFLELPDTPDNYASQALKFVRVNAAATGLEFAALSTTTLLGLTDTPDSYAGAAFKVVTVKGDESGIEFSAGATPTSFIGLTDAPASYTGHGSKTVKVKSDASGLEFVSVPAPVTAFTGLSDAPANYTGAANKAVKVNSAGTGLEFVTETAADQGAYLGAWGVTYANIVAEFGAGVPAHLSTATDEGWTLDTSVSDTGASPALPTSLRSKAIADATNTTFYFTAHADATHDQLVIRHNVSSAFWDVLEVYVDGTLVGTRNGGSFSTTFTQSSFTLSAGSHTIGLRYQKDFGATDGLDAVLISRITYPDITSHTYVYGDVVDYSGNRYMCLVPGTVQAPTVTTDWQKLTYAGGASAFTSLSDVPSSFAGQALKGVRVNAAANALEFYDEPVVVGVAWNGVPTANQVLGLFVAPFAIDFAVNMAGSSGIALVAATAQTDITVNKIAVSGHGVTAVGTVRFAAAGGAPTFIAASAFSLAVGDALQFKCPGTADATLADFSFSVAGVR